ncbi:MAG: hypothetical protein GX595_05650 [Lentisphaerae bacterium]|nr:hypothetical protein [Lentisphaerota bacterium]
MAAVAVAVLSSVVVRAAPKLDMEPETYEWGRQEENKGLYEFGFVLRTDCVRKPTVGVVLAYRPSSRVDSLTTTVRAKEPAGAAAAAPQSAPQARWPQQGQGQTGEAKPKAAP